MSSAAVAMWWDIRPEIRAEWEHWHTHEHMPERLSIPGFVRGTRWIALSGAASYFVCYEAEAFEVLGGDAYLRRLNDPTPWSRKMMPEHRNMVRSLCEVHARFGAGVGHALATLRLEGPLHADTLSALPERKGIASALLLEARALPGPQTVEQKIRGGDAEAKWVVLIGGYDADALAAAAREIAPRATTGLYRLSFCLP